LATTLFERLRTDMDNITAEYDRDFAGQNRATRDLDQMDQLIKRTKEVLARIDEIPSAAQGPQLIELRTSVVGTRDTYEGERKQISQAKTLGPEQAQFAIQASLANFVFARYGRHFAGQNRSTRDFGLLAEMIEDLKAIERQMRTISAKKKSDGFASDLEVVLSNLKMYQAELKEVEAARAAGEPEERAGALASAANDQFAIYRTNFAGYSRNTRRPQLLSRVVDTLTRIKKEMETLEATGKAGEHNANNIKIVSENLTLYQNELVEIRKARQATAMGDLLGLLGGAANALFDDYRKGFAGKNRGEVDLALLGGICDRLGEILRQMVDLSRVEENDMNAKNIDIVCDQLAMYEQEYEAVRNVQNAVKK
jgi:hypothetical protein